VSSQNSYVDYVVNFPHYLTYYRAFASLYLETMDSIKNKHKHTLMFELEAQSSTTEVHASSAMHDMVVHDKNGSRILAVDDGVSAEADISRFLSRKVQISKISWFVGASVASFLDPWFLFLNNSAVKNKLQNYNLIKGDLKLTFYINGTPFHAGLALASYCYLNGGQESITIGGDTQLVTRSQRPHIFLNPSTCKGGTICVPFFLPQNYLSLALPTVSSSHIGRLNIDSFAPLKQINSGTDAVTITIFAELANVQLTGPTMTSVSLSGDDHLDFSAFFLEAQADEYTTEGVISGPASTIANMAGKLTSVPGIGPLALATQMGAQSVAGFARFFGYSRPITLEDAKPVRNMPVHNLALTEGGDTSQKLTVTGKQEISIDPSTVNLPPIDELSLDYLTRKESYLTSFNWDVVDTVDSTLFACDVDPMAERRSSVPGGHLIIPTALSFASRPFNAWSGTLHYRFQVIASQYHRGRLAIIYDPIGPVIGDPFNTTYNTIIDLADGRDFTVSFKWQSDMGYLTLDKSNTRTFFTQATPNIRGSSEPFANGLFYVRVVNELVVPDAVSGVKILVSVSAGDDFELINPTGEGMALSLFTPVAQSSDTAGSFNMFELEAQSAVEIVPEEENAPESEINSIDLMSGVHIHEEQKPFVFYGEKISSVRQLLKRYCHYRTFYADIESGGVYDQRLATFQYLLKAMPGNLGFDTNGFDSTAAATPYWYASPTYINYFKSAYAGWRGSIRWKYLPTSNNVASMVVHRVESLSNRALVSDGRPIISSITSPGSTVSSYAQKGVSKTSGSLAGAAATMNRTMDSLEVEIPYALPIRFSEVKGNYLTSGANTLNSSFPGGNAYHLTLNTNTGGAYVAFDTYVAAGEDFTFFGFVGAPVMFSAATPLPA
jgi:hypothetical protein